MSNSLKLKECAFYLNSKVNSENLGLDNYVTTDNILPNKQGLVRVTNLPAQLGNVTRFEAGTILIANIRPYLKKIWYSDREGGCSADVLALGAKEGFFSKFLYYGMFRDDFFSHVMKGSKGTKMPRGDKTQILDFLVPNFDIKKQEDIANVLSALDAKIELNNRINSELEAMAKTLYDYWFVQFDFPNTHGNPYKTSGGKMVYTPTLKREIPESWEIKTLLDIATFTNGLACQKFRPENEKYYRVIKIREMETGFTENSEFVSVNIPEKLIVYNGDILFSWSATLDVKIWTGGIGALNQHIFKVTSKKYPKSYCYFQLLNYLQHFKMIAELRKTTMGHITQDHLKQSSITIPPIDLIVKLDDIIKPLLEKKVKLEEENQQLTQLRDWLLPMLMNGQVTVK
jgi:type I restriction enzyme S subunit